METSPLMSVEISVTALMLLKVRTPKSHFGFQKESVSGRATLNHGSTSKEAMAIRCIVVSSAWYLVRGCLLFSLAVKFSLNKVVL